MTTGLQQQAPNVGPILKTAPKPQIVGAKLTADEKQLQTPPEQRTFERI
jgi:hypothetical protein